MQFLEYLLSNYQVISLIVIGILLIISIALHIKYSISKFNLNLLSINLIDTENKLYTEQTQNTKNIQIISSLEQQINYLKQQLEDRQNNKELVKAELSELSLKLFNQLIETHRYETKEAREFSEKNITDTTTKIYKEFEKVFIAMESLTKDIEHSKNNTDKIFNALLSPIGCGNLAEITLENLLKKSGLRENLDYKLQYVFKTKENNTLRPDAVIFLPSNDLIIVDAKSSQFLTAEGDNLHKLADSMNKHLDSLINKNYRDNLVEHFHEKGEKLREIYTFMFLPTDLSVDKLEKADSNFINHASEHNIYVFGPAGLRNWLNTAKLYINAQLKFDNYHQIISNIETLIKSVGTIIDNTNRIGSNIKSLVTNYDKLAGSFNKTFLANIDKMENLGIINKKGNKFQKLIRYNLISNEQTYTPSEDSDLVES